MPGAASWALACQSGSQGIVGSTMCILNEREDSGRELRRRKMVFVKAAAINC
jgi:hypothetical protein